MTTPTRCGCRAEVLKQGYSHEVVFCPLHAAAGEMLEKLKWIEQADGVPLGVRKVCQELLTRVKKGV